ncbi:sensor histidine kinase [Streptomyces pini]|uniref:Sensor-like histidine kinase SenX3 n=1 Tax=Streptomyces pini TaxID=1520580 RepID=A0A1I3UCM6_9ACTN|nr:ATP-binding protein [Streptomyces pini]SFJ81254.1 two-component system, OmpR family, sensor histidine kinase SenX3 [Streptomyces pini]
MDVNAAVAAAAAIAGVCTGVFAMLAFRWSEREQARPTRSSLHTEAVLPPGVDTVLSVLRSSAVVLDEADAVVKASSAAYALGLVRGGRLTVEPMLKMARDTRRDGEIRQVELDLPRRGTGRGEALAVSARVAPLGSRLVLLLVEDLTEARRIEAVRRDFVANVSHELKTPVGALSLLSEAVMDASDDPEAVERFAGRMQTEATRLTNLVQELIDLSRVQNDNPLEDSEPVRVDELVAEAIDRCRQAAGVKQITMATGGTADLHVWGNRGQLAAALGNLVENAVNYSPARTRVGIAGRRVAAPGGDMIEIAVTDQGIGISDKDKDRIFERFYRVDPARSRATGGTGLGLAIVKHVAASHGGEVTVWSAEGQGSTFTLRLPEAASARERAEARRLGRERAAGALREPADFGDDDSDGDGDDGDDAGEDMGDDGGVRGAGPDPAGSDGLIAPGTPGTPVTPSTPDDPAYGVPYGAGDGPVPPYGASHRTPTTPRGLSRGARRTPHDPTDHHPDPAPEVLP